MFRSWGEMGMSPPQEGEPFPLYVSSLINLANQFAQGTRPKVVGSVAALFQQFPGHTVTEWERWYRDQHPQAVDDATQVIWAMVGRLQDALAQVDEATVRTWVEDLLFCKSFTGLTCQQAILRHLAKMRGVSVQGATPEEESKGIDGWVGDKPVSVKPVTYQGKQGLPESIDVEMVFYKTTAGGVLIYAEDRWNLISDLFGGS